MGRKGNPGGTQVIGPQDVWWFGNGGVENGPHPNGDAIHRRQKAPLTAAAEQRIFELRADLALLRKQLAALDRERGSLAGKLDTSARDLAQILHHHGLPPDPGLPPLHPQPGKGKTTRRQRGKRARENNQNGR